MLSNYRGHMRTAMNSLPNRFYHISARKSNLLMNFFLVSKRYLMYSLYMAEKQKDSYWASKISAYQECPWKCKLRYYDEVVVDTPLSGDLYYGTCIHAALEAMFEGLDFQAMFDVMWDTSKARSCKFGRFSHEYLKECGVEHLRKFHNKYFNNITVDSMEQRLFGKIGKYKFEGTPDIIGEYEGVRSCIDFKTSGYAYDKDKPLVASQLIGYDFLLEKKVDRIVYFVFVKDRMSIQKPLILDLTDEIRDAMLKENAAWIEKIAGDKVFPRNTNACIKGKLKCEYFDYCWKGNR